MSINRITLIGRMTADAEIRTLPNGTDCARFTVAVNEFVKGEDRANFFDIKAFGKTAEIIGKYTSKGSQIGIDGRLRQERWEKDGQKRSQVVIVADWVDLLSKKSEPGNEKQSNNYDDFDDALGL